MGGKTTAGGTERFELSALPEGKRIAAAKVDGQYRGMGRIDICPVRSKENQRGKISLKNLFRQMGKMFGFEVKEYANYFMNIKNRTDENGARFTDLMRDALLEKMTEADGKPPRK